MITFKDSAAKMADCLRTMKRLQQQHRDMGDDEVLMDVRDLFSAKDQAALEAYEEDLVRHSGAQRLPFGEAVS